MPRTEISRIASILDGQHNSYNQMFSDVNGEFVWNTLLKLFHKFAALFISELLVLPVGFLQSAAGPDGLGLFLAVANRRHRRLAISRAI